VQGCASRLPSKPIGRMAADRMAKGRGRADRRPNIGIRPLQVISPFVISSTSPSLRWRIERDYQELKQEVGLAHFEGRGWRGVHHHATLCIAACGFLISERRRFPWGPGPPPGSSHNLPFPKVIDPETPPLRTARYIPNSIATIRCQLRLKLF
jgi:hypothetical protein